MNIPSPADHNSITKHNQPGLSRFRVLVLKSRAAPDMVGIFSVCLADGLFVTHLPGNILVTGLEQADTTTDLTVGGINSRWLEVCSEVRRRFDVTRCGLCEMFRLYKKSLQSGDAKNTFRFYNNYTPNIHNR